MAHLVNVVRTEPFLTPADQPSSQHTDPPSSKHKATEKSVSDLSQASHRPATVEPTGQPVIRPTSSAVEPSKDSFSDSDSFTSDRPPVDLFVEEGELSDDQELNITNTDQFVSKEQTFRETMRGIRSYMG